MSGSQVHFVLLAAMAFAVMFCAGVLLYYVCKDWFYEDHYRD